MDAPVCLPPFSAPLRSRGAPGAHCSHSPQSVSAAGPSMCRHAVPFVTSSAPQEQRTAARRPRRSVRQPQRTRVSGGVPLHAGRQLGDVLWRRARPRPDPARRQAGGGGPDGAGRSLRRARRARRDRDIERLMAEREQSKMDSHVREEQARCSEERARELRERVAELEGQCAPRAPLPLLRRACAVGGHSCLPGAGSSGAPRVRQLVRGAERSAAPGGAPWRAGPRVLLCSRVGLLSPMIGTQPSPLSLRPARAGSSSCSCSCRRPSPRATASAAS